MHLAPLWLSDKGAPRFRSLAADLRVDVVIIGAGITGLTLAHRLKQAGKTVAVLDMGPVGGGATGHTSGHLTSALDVDYATLAKGFGWEGAAEAATRSRQAIDHIEAMAAEHQIAIGDRMPEGETPGLQQIERGEGRLSELRGHRVAAYRALDGTLMVLAPVCPHAGGIVQWNSAASTWDCPLHGSRFLPNGELLAGPACAGLRALPGPDRPEEPGATASGGENRPTW